METNDETDVLDAAHIYEEFGLTKEEYEERQKAFEEYWAEQDRKEAEYKAEIEAEKKAEEEKEFKEEVVKFSIIAISFVISFFITFTYRFYADKLTYGVEVPMTDYVMELTYGDGSKKVITDYAEEYECDNYEPQIESGIIHDGYYVNINHHDYYGIVSLKCLRTEKSKYSTSRRYRTDKTRYDCYKDGCPFIYAFFRGEEYLINKKWQTD